MVTKQKIMNINQLIYHATLAPSGHNTQPWKFSVDGNTVRIYPDFQRSLPVVDPDNHALYISLGCALENLVISAKQVGLTSSVDYFPEDESEECIRVSLAEESTHKEQELFEAIPVRQSNRSMYDERKISPVDVDKLLQSNIYDTVSIKTFDTKEKEAEPVIELVKEASRIQFGDRQFVEELISWIRFSKKEVQTKRDGLSAKVMGFPYIPRWLGRIILKTVAKPSGEDARAKKQIHSSSHLFLFISKKNDKRHWVDTGRTFQRIALTAASLGIAHAHLNMPCEVESVRKKLSHHLELNAVEHPVLLIRLGYAAEVPRSIRRSLDEVLINGTDK
jgi:hypothetical protein